jgi:hypothetical protein
MMAFPLQFPKKRDQMATFFNGPGESVVKRGESFGDKWRQD